jgi:hypothetical protein
MINENLLELIFLKFSLEGLNNTRFLSSPGIINIILDKQVSVEQGLSYMIFMMLCE